MAKTKNPNLRGRSRPHGSSAIEQRHPFCCKRKDGQKKPDKFTCPRTFAHHARSIAEAKVVTLQPGTGTSKLVVCIDDLGKVTQVTACNPDQKWKPGKTSQTFTQGHELIETIRRCASGTFAIEGTKGRSTVELSRGIPIRIA